MSVTVKYLVVDVLHPILPYYISHLQRSSKSTASVIIILLLKFVIIIVGKTYARTMVYQDQFLFM